MPTATYTDTKIVIDPTKSGKLFRRSPSGSARGWLAMTRYYEECGSGKLVKNEGELNPADILTEPLPEGAFKQN